MNTSIVTNDLEFDLPRGDWIDHSVHTIVLADGTLSCFVARDLADDVDAVLRGRALYITDGADDVRIEGVRDGRLGPFGCREAAVVSYEDHLWIYHRLSSASCYGTVFTLGVYGPDENRKKIDDAMDEIARDILFRRR